MPKYQFVREPLTADEATRLANACGSAEERLIVWTLLDTGMRVSELTALTRQSIDWQGRRIMIYGKGGPYGSASKRRMLPMSTRIRPLLESWFALHDSIGYTPRTVQRLLKPLANRAAISRPVSPHVLRHTFACTALQKGISLAALQRFLGHDHLTTTAIYLNLAPESALAEYEQKW